MKFIHGFIKKQREKENVHVSYDARRKELEKKKY